MIEPIKTDKTPDWIYDNYPVTSTVILINHTAILVGPPETHHNMLRDYLHSESPDEVSDWQDRNQSNSGQYTGRTEELWLWGYPSKKELFILEKELRPTVVYYYCEG